MKKRTKRKAQGRETIASAKYRQGEYTVEVSVSQELLNNGTRYRLQGSISPPKPGVLEPILPQQVFWSWAFREGDLDALIYFLAAELGYEVEDRAPESPTTTWVIWGDPKHVMIGWTNGISNGRVALPRRSANRFLSALGKAADWQIAA